MRGGFVYPVRNLQRQTLLTVDFGIILLILAAHGAPLDSKHLTG